MKIYVFKRKMRESIIIIFLLIKAGQKLVEYIELSVTVQWITNFRFYAKDFFEKPTVFTEICFVLTHVIGRGQ